MDEECCSYIKKGFERLAPVYDIIDIPLSKAREKVGA
jgi:glycerate kinase